MALICELENTKTQEVLVMDAKGTVFGRAGSNADVTLKDQAVSKRHAKVYSSGGFWYLEDLGSSNGTYLERDKIAAPVRLEEGMVFAVSRFKFRVARLQNEGGPAAASATVTRAPPPSQQAAQEDDEPLFDDGGDIAPPEPASARPAMEPLAPPMRPPTREAAPPPPSSSAGAMPDMPATALERNTPDVDDMGDGPDDLDPKAGFAFFLKAIPKAIAYYAVAVPVLALAPWKAIPDGVEHQKLPAIDKLPLAAYVFPAVAATSLFGTLCGVVVTAFTAGIGSAIGSAITGIIVGVVVSAIASLIAAFFGHKVLTWVIDKLQGESDARSRTNYMLMSLTASIIVAVPSGIGTLLSALPIPLINALGPLLGLVGTLISLFVTFSWVKYFRLHQLVPKIVLVLGALAVVGSLYGFVSAVIGGVKAILTSDGSSPTAPDDDEDDDKKDDEDKDEDDDKKDDEDKDEDDDKKDPKKDDKKDDDKKDPKKDDKKDDDKKDPKKDDKKDDDGPKGKNPSMSFKAFTSAAKSVDDKLSSDPSLIEKKGVRDLLEKVSSARYEAEKSYQSKLSKNPSLEMVHASERDLEVYRKTADAIEKLQDLVK